MTLGKKISELPSKLKLDGKEVLAFAHNGQNGSLTINAILDYIVKNSSVESNIDFRLYSESDYTIFDQGARVQVIKENVPEINMI